MVVIRGRMCAGDCDMGERPAGVVARAEERQPGSERREWKASQLELLDTDERYGEDDRFSTMLHLPRREPENDVALARMLALAMLAGLGIWIVLFVVLF